MTVGTLSLPETLRRPVAKVRTPAVQKAIALAPLLAILVVQAILTHRLLPYVGSDHDDETIYIYGGHQLIYELLHGGGSPYYETWYSGAPVLYPVLAALADTIGGLTAAREMSMLFMLGATALLFFTGRRLFGYWVGVISAALFAGLGLTQNLGALATIDAPSLLLLTCAAYCAVRAANGTRWLIFIPVFLLAANATKYVTVIFDPVVIALAASQLIPQGWTRVGRRVLALGAVSLVTTIIAIFLAGAAYLKGIMFTTLARKGGAQYIFGAHFASNMRIFSLTWQWTGGVLALGCIALLVMCLYPSTIRKHGPVLLVLIFAGFIVTLGNIRLHTDQSMDKHDDFGAWFTCIAAGYALAHVADTLRRWWRKILALAVAVVVTAGCCYHYSQMSSVASYFRTTSISTYEAETYSFLTPYLKPGSSEYLLASEDDFVMVYDNHLGLHWWQFFDDTYVKYPIPGRGGDAHDQAQGLACGGPGQPTVTDPKCMYLEGVSGYTAAIRSHWFALVTLAHAHGLPSDQVILDAVRSTPGYVQIFDLDGAPTFIYTPDYPAWEARHAATLTETPKPPPPAKAPLGIQGER